MGVQSQMIMQNNHNPHLLHHSYHNQYSNDIVTNTNVNVAGCHWFPVSDWSTWNRDQNAQLGIDSYINFQCEKLRKMVQEQRSIELAWLVNKFETRTLSVISKKDEQIRQQMLHIMELQSLNSTIQLENDSLHSLAKQNQATIESLNQAVLQLHEDAESCCDEPADVTSRRESSERLRMICGGCDLREANVVFLPCRHLCACDACENEMHLCPFCKMHKSCSFITLVF